VTDVLVVGAGPTGLALAAQVRAYGARVRIVERRVGSQDSRAIVMHPRTLEVLAPLGVADQLVRLGNPSGRVVLQAAGRSASVDLARPDVRDTAYPFLLAIPQATVERVLEAHLRRAGVVVERGVELIALAQGPHSVGCELRGPHGRCRTQAAYLVGCDGADSTVRRLAGIGFPGRPYRPRLLLADVTAIGDLYPGALHAYVGADGVLFLFPSTGETGWRLVTVAASGSARADLAALRAVTDRFTGGRLHLDNPTWAATLCLRRGQADRYRHGRVLLAGDAAHVHSPAVAQGMNTGIQDACNLGWKLAMVARAEATDGLLDSYESERWPVARRVRQLTDLAFLVEAGGHPALRWLRGHLAPLLLPLVRGRILPAPAFRLIGGLSLRYRRSPAVAEGRPRLRGGVRAGDRLIDGPIGLQGEDLRLHQLLRPPGFHLLLCGLGEMFDLLEAHRLPRRSPVPLQIHRLADRRLLARLGVRDSAVYLVRPDGYVAYRARGPSLDGVTRYLSDLAPHHPARPAPASAGGSTEDESPSTRRH
jgi:2-polyprenyl-6-methoxyphenol hydroxylase-like FAD-dependent oxidoreductase